MTVSSRLFPFFGGTEHVVDVIGEATGYSKQRRLAGCVMVGDGRLYQVASDVQLVGVPEFSPAFVALASSVEVVDVAAWFLGVGNLLDDCIDLSFKDRVGVGRQTPGGGFEPLVDIGIVEVKAFKLIRFLPGTTPKIGESAGFFQQVELAGNCDLVVDPNARRPKRIVQAHGIDRSFACALRLVSTTIDAVRLTTGMIFILRSTLFRRHNKQDILRISNKIP